MVPEKRVDMPNISEAVSPVGNSSLMKWLGASVLVIVLDQLTKLWISSHFAYGESYAVTSFFNLVLWHNTGASFSMLSDASGWQRWLFSGIATVAAIWII